MKLDVAACNEVIIWTSDAERSDVRSLLKVAVDIIVQGKRIDGRFRVNEIYFEP